MSEDELLAAARLIAARVDGGRAKRTRASAAQKARVRRRAGNVCEGCGASDGLRVHHVVPASRGGTNRGSNLRLYCPHCEAKDHRRARL